MVLPSVRIYEEPERRKRFRYATEGRSTPLQGVTSTPTARTPPSIEVANYDGLVTIAVSCVTAGEYPRNHPHRFVGRNCSSGVYILRIRLQTMNSPTIITFPELYIERCLRKEIPTSLEQRASSNLNLPVHGEDNLTLDVHTVRLCFQVIPDPQNPAQFSPVFSQPIRNYRGSIKICHIGPAYSPASGGQTVLIVCNRIIRGQIEIQFYEENANGEGTFIGLGVFQNGNVHNNAAISFTTPSYNLRFVDAPINAFVEIVRLSDDARSNRIPFQYIPDVNNIPQQYIPQELFHPDEIQALLDSLN